MNAETLKIQDALVSALLDKRALNVLTMDVCEVTPLADCFVVASGNSDVHMNALTTAVTDCLDQFKEEYRIEGATSSQWTLIDAGNVVIHIFSVKAREYYKVEHIWGDAIIKHYESHD